MSSLVFLKDHKGHKKNQVAAVPFLEAKDLVAAGIAARWNGGKTPTAPTPEIDNAVTIKRVQEECLAKIKKTQDEALAAMQDAAKEHAGELEKVLADNAKLKVELEAANAKIADLTAKKK